LQRWIEDARCSRRPLAAFFGECYPKIEVTYIDSTAHGLLALRHEIRTNSRDNLLFDYPNRKFRFGH
jgi:hypothetical protein